MRTVLLVIALVFALVAALIAVDTIDLGLSDTTEQRNAAAWAALSFGVYVIGTLVKER